MGTKTCIPAKRMLFLHNKCTLLHKKNQHLLGTIGTIAFVPKELSLNTYVRDKRSCAIISKYVVVVNRAVNVQ